VLLRDTETEIIKNKIAGMKHTVLSVGLAVISLITGESAFFGQTTVHTMKIGWKTENKLWRL